MGYEEDCIILSKSGQRSMLEENLMLQSNEKIGVDQWKYTIAQSPLMGQDSFYWGSSMEAL